MQSLVFTDNCQCLGKLDEAERLFEKALLISLLIYEAERGPDQLAVLLNRNNLDLVYFNWKKLEVAKQIF